MNKFGLITRIASLVVIIEIAAFSALGWTYIGRFSAMMEDSIYRRLQLVGQMIARNELAVTAISNPQVMQGLVGAPYVNGVIIGGSGRVIVALDPAFLGRKLSEVPGLDADWFEGAPSDDRIVTRPGTLTSVTRLQGGTSGTPVYSVAITVSTADLEARKRSVALLGWAISLIFILVTSAGIVLVAQRLITRRVHRSLKVLKQVENGALGARITVEMDDELGQLQHGINSMTAKLGTLLNQHRRNEEEIGAILDAIGDGVIAIAPDGGILRCNPSAATILGLRPGAGVPSHISALLPEMPSAEGDCWWRATTSLTAKGRLHFERHSAEGIRSIELGHGPILDTDGTVTGGVLVLQDVTARKQAEKELREAVERLTVSNSELERFAYVASHDLQEPLRTITSFTQLLDRHLGAKLEQDDRENFAFIVGAAKRMSLLINDLLAYSRVNTRGIQFSRVALKDACASALDNLRETIAESQAEITIEELPEVMGDSVQLMQVFQNLIGNAIKFHRPDTTPRVTVSAQRGEDEWLISVADNGIGVAESNQDIFEIFRRLHTAAAYPGSGVGLAICKRIVQRHYGHIWFDTSMGKGTTFTFSLPIAAETTAG